MDEEVIAARALPFISSIEVCGDGFLEVKMQGACFFTVEVSHKHHKLQSTYYGPSSSGDLRPGDLSVMMQELYEREGKRVAEKKHFDPWIEIAEGLGEGEGDAIRSAISEDVVKYCSRFGDGSAIVESLGLTNRIELKVPAPSFVSSTVASAWGFRSDVPISVLLNFSGPLYTQDAVPPQVKVEQAKKRFKVSDQLTRILRRHVEQCWTTAGFTHPATCEDLQQNELTTSAMVGQEVPLSVVPPNGLVEAAEASCGTGLGEAWYDGQKDSHEAGPQIAAQGFLVHIAEFLLKRIPTLADYCVLCDKLHQCTQMFCPAVCSRDLCVFGMRELKLALDSARTEVDVVGLLVTIFRAAAFSQRKSVLNPYPKVADPSAPLQLALDPEKQDRELLNTIVRALPIGRGLRLSDDVKLMLDEKDRRAYPLLEWIVSSNRSHIVAMQPTYFISGIPTVNQFILVTAAPEKESKFRKLKSAHKTRFAFHGSAAENWHSILRNGLKNMSGTPNMMNGAAFGPGIYLAPSASSCVGYCLRSRRSSDDPEARSGLHCLTLCEIIDDGTIQEHGWCWRVLEEEKVLTRFLFCFDDTGIQLLPNSKADTSQRKLLESVKSAMAYYKLD